MPITRKAPEITEINEEYVERIAQEIRSDNSDGPNDAPYIIEEPVPYSNHLRVTVIWDVWNEASIEDRGRVILRAYQEARGLEDMLAITIAMGLTRQEADRLGISWR